MSKAWPRLSETLTGPHDLEHCWRCGSQQALTAWVEHDEQDRPEPLTIVLCDKCGDLVIEPHPRLYRPLSRHEPFPGAMPVCVGCVHQTTAGVGLFNQGGLRCIHPAMTGNGGEGLGLVYPEPSVGFIDYAGKGGRRCGHRITIWNGPVECPKKEQR